MCMNYTKKEVFEIEQKPLIMYSRYYWIIVDAINSTNEFDNEFKLFLFYYFWMLSFVYASGMSFSAKNLKFSDGI